jgi:DnaK suppressor protein
VKAPATRTAKTAPPASSGAKARPAVAASKGKSVAKPASTAKAKPSKMPTSSSTVAKKAAVTARTAPAKAAKPAPKASPKVAAKPAAKVVVKSAPKKPVPKPAAKAPAPTKAAAPASARKTAAHAPAPAPTRVPAPAPKKASGPAKAPVVQAPIEPTPRPLGKRAAKKVMMEQMTQAAVVPTHAPDAAKATFSTMNERAVMTPPVPSSIQKDPKRANNWKNLSVDKLTDQDVQAMPDSEYMNDVQLAYFRLKLTQLKADMLANAGETTEHLREDTVVVPDPADRATIEEEHALELRTRDRERKLLKKIEQAIARIDAGDYGYCEETGEAIGVGRLMARPTASLSLEAQQRRELKQKMFGD